MTYRSIVDDATYKLKSSGIEDARNDAIKLFIHMLNIDMGMYINDEDKNIEDIYDFNTIRSINIKYDNLINARSQRYPLQYILGETYFYGLRFIINDDVLIPRSDTETLVDIVLNENNDKNINILDMCTGSGCIAISLSKYGKYKNIVASDISDDAIDVARHNARNLLDDSECNMYFVKSDMFDNIDKIKENIGIDKYDIITINPPYIRSSDIDKLMPEVKDHEPRVALDGDKDGLKYYKIISKNIRDYINDNGRIYMEIGYDQAEDIKKLFLSEGYENIEVVKDLSGNDRVIKIYID